MKLIIDIPEEDYKFIKDLQFYNSGRRSGRTIEQNVFMGIRNGIPYDERPQGDSISRDALKKALHSFFDGKVIDEPAYILRDVLCHIDSAPVVKPCENCDLYFKAMTKEELKEGGAE
jgi:hypothetical protein